jgi:hypothetical protein
MNPDTRVAVCCYAGDAHQVIGNLDLYLHHQCPLVILSPEDSKVEIPNVENRSGGAAGHIGGHTLERERRHLEILLSFPEKYFMIHDADSVCLDPEFPAYLYAEPDLVWSNQVNDAIPQHQATFPAGWPHVAFQPPYFLSRKTIEAMLAVADQIVISHDMMPFIDYYMVQLTMTAGLPWRRFESCACCHPSLAMRLASTDGINIFHGIKDPKDTHALLAAHRKYLAGERGLRA